jgi:hypothetical protein
LWSYKKREHGVGFFTGLAADSDKFPPIGLRSPLGHNVWISVEGLQHGIGFLVWLTDGYPTQLEGFTVADDDTSKIDFGAVHFTVRDAQPTKEGR